MYRVGFVHSGYNEKRNIFGAKYSDFVHKKVVDLFKIFDYLYFKIYKKTNLFTHNSFNDKYSFPKLDIYHFFNAVNYGNKPWICTFETTMPRYNNKDTRVENALKAMAKQNCKKLIAFSEFNKNLQIKFLKDNFPEYAESIIPKVEVIYPPQNLINNDKIRRFENINPLKVLFVGHDFFRKGGREVFKAVSSMTKAGHNVELTVISKLNYDNWISFTSELDTNEWKSKLKKASFCNYYEYLGNSEVKELMQQSHLFIIPSLQETFGYVVLEAQACGTPVISTSIRAFPEINNSECGWLIDIPQTEKGAADVYSNGYDVISKKIELGIFDCLLQVVNQKEMLFSKSQNCVVRIRKYHNIEDFSNKIVNIYRTAIS
ncbi:MAG: glycosyltransferase family 4 protein [Bacteroidia bacterium]